MGAKTKHPKARTVSPHEIRGILRDIENLTHSKVAPSEFLEISEAAHPIKRGSPKSGKNSAKLRDPHFRGFDGSKFDFHGRPGYVFNIITDSKFQVNAEFTASASSGETFMGRLGIRIDSHRILVTPESVELNGVAVAAGEARELRSLTAGEGLLTRMRNHVAIVFPRIHIGVFIKKHAEGSHLDFSSQINCFSNPHGILGQTARFLVEVREPTPIIATAKSDNTIGFLEGNPEDYLVSDGIFGTEFVFNRFDQEVLKYRHHHFVSAHSDFAAAAHMGL